MSSQEEHELKIQEAKQAYIDATNDWDRQTAEGNIKYVIYMSYIWQLGNTEETQLISITMANNDIKDFVDEVKEIYGAFN